MEIEIARAQKVLTMYGGLAENLQSVTFENQHSKSDTKLIFSYVPGPPYLNVNKNMHGGVIASMIDILTTVALMAADRDHRGGVTVELATAYSGSLKQGQKIYFHVSVDKVGKNLGFSSCKVYSESNEILVNAHHTKFFASSKL